jgi:NADH-quinone oxidoreductase subunit E
MSALRIAQVEKGWLAPETIAYVAEYLGMPPIAVYEVATFYNMYERQPCGRHKITLCTNLPCQLQGADAIAEHLKHRLGVEFGETTADGRYTLREGECMGACGDGPLCLHNNHKMHVHLTPEQVDKLLDELK